MEFGWKGNGGNVLAFPPSQEFVGERGEGREGNLPKGERRS